MKEIEPNHLLVAAALIVLAPAAASFTPPEAAPRTAFATPAPGDGWFMCDAVDAPVAALVGARRPDGTVDITLVAKTQPATMRTARYEVGGASPGAGQVEYALSQGGRPVGSLRQFNPASYGDLGAVRTPPFTSVTLGGRTLSCRWLAGTRFAGLGPHRSYVVTQGPQGLSWRSFDYGKAAPLLRPDGAEQTNQPTLAIEGGIETRGPDGSTTLRFENADYVYELRIPAQGVAGLTISTGGKPVSRETMLASVFTAQVQEPPRPAVRLAAGGWPHLGQGDVWNSYTAFYCSGPANEECLYRQMKNGGATPAALAFTKRLTKAQSPGFMSNWDDDGPVGIATVTYPFRSPPSGQWMVPSDGPPLDTDAYKISDADRRRPDVHAVLTQFPTAYVAKGGTNDTVPLPLPDGGLRILWKSYLTVCDDCQPQGAVTVGYDFDRAGRFTRAGIVDIH